MTSVLWVSAQPPALGAGGGPIRQAALLRGLAAAAETDLLLAGRLEDDELRGSLRQVVEVPARARPLPDRAWTRRARHLTDALVLRLPPEVVAHRPVRRALAPALAAAASYDVVCIDSIGLAPLLDAGRQNRWVLNLHNRPSGMAAQRRALSPGGRRAWLLRQEEHQTLSFERWAAEHYDLLVAVSVADAIGLRGNVAVIPNGVDTAAVRPSPLPAEPRLVFTGALYTLPNIDGAVWFCREVLPLVRRSMPTVSLDVVGSAPAPEVRALGALAGVAVHPDVPSVVPHLAAARLALVPLRIGTGTRVKALEAMAAGRPVVGTSVGLDGLGLTHGRDAWFADSPADLAAAVVRLLQDDDLSRSLAGAGRRLVEEHHDWSAIGDAYAQAVLGRWRQPVTAS